jgi:hypothetical protein
MRPPPRTAMKLDALDSLLSHSKHSRPRSDRLVSAPSEGMASPFSGHGIQGLCPSTTVLVRGEASIHSSSTRRALRISMPVPEGIVKSPSNHRLFLPLGTVTRRYEEHRGGKGGRMEEAKKIRLFG